MMDQIADWQYKLAVAGISIRAIAWFNLPQFGASYFEATLTEPYPYQNELNQAWQQHQKTINVQNPIRLDKIGHDFLFSYLLASSDENPMIVGVLVAPPVNDQTLQIIQLSLGWLYYYLSIENQTLNQRSAQLLTLLGHVISQSNVHEAMQEWVNQTTVWANQSSPQTQISLILFRIEHDYPKVQVMSSVVWAEKGAPLTQMATDIAIRCSISIEEVTEPHWWALPLTHEGHVVAVVVAYQDNIKTDFSDSALQIIRASASVVEPIFRLWKKSTRSLFSHIVENSYEFWKRLIEPEYMLWKVSVAVSIALLSIILLIPVDDVVTAHLYIEGGNRRILTTPQNGYLSEVFVRPGDKVSHGQLLARLEDKDLKLEETEIISQMNQAESHFREAMATGDIAQSGIASNQKQQAQAKLSLIRAKLSRVNIQSPMDGHIVSGDWQQQIGAPVEEGKELFQIADSSEYKAILHIPDKDIDQIHMGQMGSLRLASLPNRAISFQISRLTAITTVEEGSNGFQVEAKLLDSSLYLNPGMQGVAKVVVGRTNLFGLWTKNFRDWIRLKLWSWW